MKKINLLAVIAVFIVMFLAGCALKNNKQPNITPQKEEAENSEIEDMSQEECVSVSEISGDQFDQ